MADRVILARALDSNGDIVPAAEAYFFETGTTTPATVYSDSAGTTAVSQPLTADSAGNFAATFATEVLKVDVRTPEGVSLPGFPGDPHYQVQTSAGSAALVSFVATASIARTNVQDAIEQVQSNVDAKAPLASPELTGTPTAPTAAVGTNTTQVATTAWVNAQVLDEDDMATDSATRPASQQSVKAYVDAASPIKAWVNFNGTGTVAIRASLNVSSITDSGTGVYAVNFSTAMADANYAVSLVSDSSVASGTKAESAESLTTTSFTARFVAGGVVNDPTTAQVIVVGN